MNLKANISYKSNEITWISLLQGYSMLLVVIGHVIASGEGQYQWENIINKLIYSFHMPLFMFTSGYLFNLTSISKRRPYLKVISNKAQVLLPPYFGLPLVVIPLKFIASAYMKRSVNFSLQQLFDSFIWLKNMPLGEMWFLNVLFSFFLISPIFAYASQTRIRKIVASILICAPVAISMPHILTFVIMFDKVIEYVPFFFAGILFSQSGIEEKASQKPFLFMSILVMIVAFNSPFNIPATRFLTSMAGICASISMAIIVDKNHPLLLSSFRNYTYQIFLLGIFAQIFLRILLKNREGAFDTAILYFLSIISAIYIPVGISKLVEKYKSNSLGGALAFLLGMR